MCKILNSSELEVFLIATYVGVSKQANISIFLHDMLDEMKVLSKGFLVDGKIFNVQIWVFICDTRARPFICATKAHNALNCCYKCCQKGSRIGHRTVFCSTVGPSRTDQYLK